MTKASQIKKLKKLKQKIKKSKLKTDRLYSMTIKKLDKALAKLGE